MIKGPINPITILLAEDEKPDVELVKSALEDTKLAVTLKVVSDGVELLDFLRREGEYSDAIRPDLIMMDLNMPRKSGREALAEIKIDNELKDIPIVVMTSSEADQDISQSYKLHANCFVRKPLELDDFEKVVKSIGEFWFTIVKLP